MIQSSRSSQLNSSALPIVSPSAPTAQPRKRAVHVRIGRIFEIERAGEQHDEKRRNARTEKCGDRAGKLARALAAVDREIENVRSGKHLREFEAIHELVAVHPALGRDLMADAGLLAAAERGRRDRRERQRDVEKRRRFLRFGRGRRVS